RQAVRRERPDVEDDLAVAHVLDGNARALVDRDQDLRGVAVVDAPFVHGAQQVRLGRRRLARGGHLRITFSEGVSASMNAGLENNRSAYFMRGAAAFGSDIP